MRIRSLRFKRQFARLCLLLCTLIGVQSQAIISIPSLPADSTPLLLKSLKAGHDEYFERYKENTKASDPLKPSIFWIRVKAEDVEPVFKEILLAQLNSYKQESHTDKVLTEFQRLQADILSRGYEPSQIEYFARARDLSLIWNGEYFDFKLSLDYQPVGQKLQSGDQYPEVSLKGSIYLKCEDPIESPRRFDNCVVEGADIREATIEWDTMPSPRGGNSSAGGTTTKQDVMAKAVIVKDLKMAESLGLLQKSANPSQKIQDQSMLTGIKETIKKSRKLKKD